MHGQHVWTGEVGGSVPFAPKLMPATRCCGSAACLSRRALQNATRGSFALPLNLQGVPQGLSNSLDVSCEFAPASLHAHGPACQRLLCAAASLSNSHLRSSSSSSATAQHLPLPMQPATSRRRRCRPGWQSCSACPDCTPPLRLTYLVFPYMIARYGKWPTAAICLGATWTHQEGCTWFGGGGAHCAGTCPQGLGTGFWADGLQLCINLSCCCVQGCPINATGGLATTLLSPGLKVWHANINGTVTSLNNTTSDSYAHSALRGIEDLVLKILTQLKAADPSMNASFIWPPVRALASHWCGGWSSQHALCLSRSH